jgi:hypothetical protein
MILSGPDTKLPQVTGQNLAERHGLVGFGPDTAAAIDDAVSQQSA